MLLGEGDRRENIKKIVVGVTLSAVLVSATAYFLSLLDPVSAPSAGDIVVLEVRSGDGYKKIVDNLSSKHLIRSKAVFKLLSLLSGSAATLKPGVYRFHPSMSSGEILSKLVAGAREEIVITIIEGATVYDIDAALVAGGILPRGAVAAAAQKFSLEGKLFPDTYKFFTDSEVEEVMDKFAATFAAKVGPLLSGMSERSAAEVLILASLVEKEVPDFEERKIVAGILKKRLEVGMPLQVDATLCYIKEVAAYPAPQKCYPLHRLDFKIESPYNTYMHAGLPPGPIGNPGLAAIIAVIHPKSSDYWYYLSDPATNKTIFSKDLDEQQQNRVKYLR